LGRQRQLRLSLQLHLVGQLRPQDLWHLMDPLGLVHLLDQEM
jgi:hypothetical protein